MLIEYGVWGSRLVLAGVFGLSAWGKLVDGAGTRKALAEFGIPVRGVAAVALGVPVVEAVIAIALLLPATVWGGSVAALLLLAVFTAAIVRLLLRGEHPSCACFGAASAAPIGTATLVRNGVLLTLTALVAVGALRYPRVPSVLPADAAIGLALIAVLGVVLTWSLGELRELRRRVDEQTRSSLGAEGLPVGAVAPEFELLDVDGGRTDLRSLLANGKSVLLVFVHPGCEMCAALARELPRWQARVREAVTIVLVGNGDVAEHAEWGRAQQVGEIEILVQQGNEAALRYRVRGTPSGVLIGADGRVAAAVARGAMAIRDLITTAKTNSRSSRRGRAESRSSHPVS
ncbi:MauE/DoxX family redox-associated membrane protein [Nocardia mangyaensis]|uniref:MauE/DoxX family redox-associated membrane protein n=1 Tax=Nocardia mangyaensis TaxID=2213200 RepID=UPI0026767447|nr:MauE/DoxX family redox-associated membrane protein [Nocardia mangyaensis]MDO3646225.1 redoxin domain-containing protein [Nocardia mangyaensis]